MKKTLYAALVTLIAICGAYADTVNLYPRDSNTPAFTCQDEGILVCSVISGAYYEKNSTAVVPASLYEALFYE